MTTSRFLVFDGHGLMWRALHRPGPPLTSPNTGEPTRGTYTFARMLLALLQQFQPAYLAFAGDSPRSQTFRRELFDGYKAKRPTTESDDSLFIQVRRCKEIVRALGVPWITVKPFEADDVIATLVDICSSPEVDTIVVSSDHDLHQLVGPYVKIYDHGKEVMLDETAVQERWGVPASRIEEVMVLSGDPGDNVPGVPGVGMKTAVKLIDEYGTVETVFANRDALSKIKREALETTDLQLARKLVALRRDVPINVQPEDLEFDGVDLERIAPLFLELGFQSLL